MRPGGFGFSGVEAVSQDPLAVAHSELKYTIRTDDFLFRGAEASVPTYTDLWFSVVSEFFPDVGHCRFDVGAEIAEYWTEKRDQFAAAEVSGVINLRIVRTASATRLVWDGVQGGLYKVQHRGGFDTATPWIDLEVVEDGSTVFPVPETLTSGQQQFFRVLQP